MLYLKTGDPQFSPDHPHLCVNEFHLKVDMRDLLENEINFLNLVKYVSDWYRYRWQAKDTMYQEIHLV